MSGKNAPEGKGYFVAPTLFLAKDSQNSIFHEKKFLGLVQPFFLMMEMPQLLLLWSPKEKGCLVSSLYTSDPTWLQTALVASCKLERTFGGDQ